MRKTFLVAFAVALLLVSSVPARQASPSAIPDEKHLKDIRQLTFGGQNAEAYFSPDGRRIIFQSTRDGLQCDQIFTMNPDGSKARMVSTGKGRTTCAYFMPDGRHFIYASTHEAGAACPEMPANAMGRGGYSWPVFSAYDVYLADENGKIVQNLTHHPGYDAEATVNWKTGRIVWTSHRNGDIDLYSMDSSGRDVKRLTNGVGYDGGAFYSNDGQKLVWRAHYPTAPGELDDYRSKLAQGLVTPMKMELMVAGADGKNPRQITSFGCASFAPFFTPDGQKIIFASNKNDCDSRNFDLYVVNTDGTGLEQLSHFGGFTSFPIISPDGKKVLFVSDKAAKQRYEFNVFIADWLP
jgi:Tol biopolymer transport system component